MQEITLKQNNISVTISKPDGESREELVELMSTALSWIEAETIVLGECELEDDNIYCEGIEPSEEREIEGL